MSRQAGLRIHHHGLVLGGAAGEARGVGLGRPFQQDFAQTPIFLADMQTNNNSDTASLRADNAAPTGVQLKVEEEQSKDTETTHPEETVGYLAFDQTE